MITFHFLHYLHFYRTKRTFIRFLRRPDFQEAARFACTLRIYTRNKNILCVKKLCYLSILFEDVTLTMINGNTVTCQ